MNTDEINQETGKIEREFSGSIKKLVAILGTEKALKPNNKVPLDELEGIVKDLLADEKEKNRKEVSDQLKALLKGHADLKAEVLKKKRELEQVEQIKMQEFNKAAKQLFNRIEELDKKEKEYYSALTDASKVESSEKGE